MSPHCQNTRKRSYLNWLKSNAPHGYRYESDHFKKIADLVDRMVSGKIDRARVHMPPGHAKTETITWRLPAYWWQNVDKKARILITCYNQTYAKELGWQIREFAREQGIELREDSNAKDMFRTTAGGVLMACGVGATPTGRRFDVIIGDDPIKDRKQIESELLRNNMDQWWKQGIMTRLLPGGRVFLVFTRWHEDDIGGRLEQRAKEGGDVYETLLLPAVDDNGRALWPEKYPIEALERIKLNIVDGEGLRSWEALYQQNPTPREGALFKVSNFQYCERAEVPELKRTAWYWDLAATAGGGDYTVGVLMGIGTDDNYYILRVVRGQWSVAERYDVIKSCAAETGHLVPVWCPLDPGAAGVEASRNFKRELAGYTVKEFRETGSKALRAEPYASAVERGAVYLVRGPWTTEFVEEHRTFPVGKHDDQVDAAAGVFNGLHASRGFVFIG